MRDLFGEPSVGANGIDVAGVDEVGRGPLAGPVVAGAVVLDPGRKIKGLKDSKELKADQREELAASIRECAIAWALGRAEVAEIDRINILRATLVAMRRAVDALSRDVRIAYIDGNMAPAIAGCATVTVIGGDAKVPAISAASIVARSLGMPKWLPLRNASRATDSNATRVMRRSAISRRSRNWDRRRCIGGPLRPWAMQVRNPHCSSMWL